MSEQNGDALRVQEIMARHHGERISTEASAPEYCPQCIVRWPCELGVFLARLDVLTAERDAARAWSARWKDVARRLSRAARKQAREHYTSWQRACDDTVRLAAERDALRARAERAELALAGMLESYELCMGSELAFSALTKDILRGVFINEPERARAALAAAGEGE